MAISITYSSVFYIGAITQDPPVEIRDWVSHRVVIPEWINAAPVHESVLRVRELVGKLHLVQSDIDAYPDEDAHLTSGDGSPSPIPDRVKKILDKQDEVVGMLCEHFITHGVEHSWDRHFWSIPLVPVSVPGEFILERKCWEKDGKVTTEQVENARCIRNPVGEGEVLVRIASLALSGELRRLRECSNPACSEWFYAERSNTIHHNDQCRLAHNASSPERKERRRKYHLKYELDERERQLKMESL